jgi:aryl-alcohol dehydrogenase-like predicted oxidoreductase
MTRERIAKLPEGDWRGRDPEFREPRLSQNLKLVDRLRGISEKYGRPVGQVAVAWVLRNPAVTAAIVGARSPQQVEQNVGAAELHLTDDDVAEIEGVGEHKPNFASAT